MSGQFGTNLISEYVQQLGSFASLGIPDIAKDAFTLSLQAMAESWKRLVFPTQSLPFTLFQLADLDHECFLKEYARLRRDMQSCRQCADLEFSTPVLNFIPLDCLQEDHLIRAKVCQIKHLLQDIDAPLSSDLVECLHGYSQHLLHRWRGCKPTDSVAQQRVLWTQITKLYSSFRTFLWDRHGDKHSGHRMHRFGRSSCNQYTADSQTGSADAHHVRARTDGAAMTFDKMDRLRAFGQESSIQNPRKLSGTLVACVVDLVARRGTLALKSGLGKGELEGETSSWSLVTIYHLSHFCWVLVVS